MDLATFLRARLDEDEAALRPLVNGRDGQRLPGGWDHWGEAGEHISHAVDFTRMLHQVEANRAILEAHAEEPEWPQRCKVCLSDRRDFPELWNPDAWPCLTLRAIAAVYSDHPDYKPEWKP